MKKQSVYSPAQHAIYPAEYYSRYDAAGVWPSDGIEISDEDAARFNGSNEPTGKMVSMVEGKLCWIDRPPRILTKEEIIEQAEQKKSALLAVAATEIEWRQYAVDKGIATGEESAALDEWQMYRVFLKRVDTSKAPDIKWPIPPVQK